MRRLMLVGPVACALAWIGGSHGLAALAGAVLYVPSVLGRGARPTRIAATAAAPVLVFSTALVDGIWDARVILLLLAAVLAWVPLFIELGRRVPVAIWSLPIVLLLTGAVLAGPWGVPLVLTDIAPRAQVLVLAVMTLLVHTATRRAD